MAIHPIEFRYSTLEMYDVFTEDNILQRKLDVEAALARAHVSVGNIPSRAAEVISKQAKTSVVKLERVKLIEKETKHDVMAIVKALAENCGGSGKYVHLGATSYDIVDTAWALVFMDAISVIRNDLVEFRKILLAKARRYKKLVMVGRTHGQHGTPITLGLKFAVWVDEVDRHLKRLDVVEELVSVGKMTGAVGSAASFGKNAEKIQTLVMEDLGLKEPVATTQIVQRDRHADVIFVLVLIGQTLSKIGREIRNLQRTEIGELEEPFAKKQVGSSTMPQKRNPWRSERVCGLARYLRSNLQPAVENIVLEHERDLSDSSCERIIFPESFVICDFMLQQMNFIVDGLVVNEENVKKNLEITKGRVMGEAVMIKLVERGMGRQDAHTLVRACAMKSFEKGTTLEEELLRVGGITKLIPEKELKGVLKPENYVGRSESIVDGLSD